MPDVRADLAIVGGGIVGAWVAVLAAQRQPRARVVLLERSLVGRGASHYGGAIRVRFGTTPTHRRLAVRSEQLYDEAERRDLRLPQRRTAVYWTLRSDGVDAFLPLCVGNAIRPADGAERAALLERVPDLTLPEDGALLVDEASCGPPGETAAALVRAFVGAYGGVCFEGTKVDAIEPADEGCRLHTADGATVHAASVLRATGPWGGDLAEGNGAPLRIKKVVAYHLEARPYPNDPIIYLYDEKAYFLPDPDNQRWIFCIESEDWDVAPDGARLHLSRRDREIAESVLRRCAPSMTERMRGGRVFCDGYSPDRVPSIAHDRGLDRCVHALGCSGSGYRLSPAIAERALKLLGF